MLHHDNENDFMRLSDIEKNLDVMSYRIYHGPLVETVQQCEATCEHMITFLLRKHETHMRLLQIQLLRDCADICTSTAKYLARDSAFSKTMSDLCGYICETCGKECSKFPDAESQECARICLQCARECRSFAMSK